MPSPSSTELANTATTSVGFKGATAYGWLFMLTGVYLLVTGLMTLIEAQQGTSATSLFGNAKSISVGATLVQALLFGATGAAILQVQKIAGTLVWVVVVLSGFGVIFRGFIPLDFLLWVLNVGLAIWYTKKQKLIRQHTETFERPSQTSSHGMKIFVFPLVLAVFAGCVVLTIAVRPGSERARKELANLNFTYDKKSFAKAAANGDTIVVQLFLKSGMNPNDALAAAASHGQTGMVRFLLNSGADINQVDEAGFTPLIGAAIAGDVFQAKILLDNGANASVAGRHGDTPLFWAAGGKADLVRLLLDRGADANAPNNDGVTPLLAALVEGNSKVVQVLVERGAIVDESSLSEVGRSRLHHLLAETGGAAIQ